MQDNYCGCRFEPEPPKKRNRRREHRGPRNSEFHDAIASFGLTDKTGKLSDGEFARQYVAEIGYMADKASYHFGRALDSAAELLGRIL